MIMLVGCLAQNLVRNPSFEQFNECPTDFNRGYYAEIAPFWESPSKATPDYFNSCSKFNVSVPINAMGSMFANDGSAYAGFILFQKPQKRKKDSQKPYYREFIQGRLLNELVKDSLYLVSYAYCIAPFSTYIVYCPNFYFSDKPVKSDDLYQFANHSQITADSSTLNNLSSVWYKVSKIYKARGGEKYITIGNFFNDQQTSFKQNDYSDIPPPRLKKVIEDDIAYYYIDLVEVSSIDYSMK